ncbi:OmpA family protein [Zobellia galactanivorans]|uniref:OmpA family protein n=1 Tax=Zobellia galactanivorans (strain DSM 12802 / CCUG 47099 / CIP 106680 / NCIMB 13871 / Dsij) TaxID=63186 RepID=UPI001C079BA7|nr:OmpA family protein [Zobellia galactanivorans]MBU3025356.1 OmpA family protein [Zobellia galactanivorans]
MRRNLLLFIGLTLLCFSIGTSQMKRVKEADKKFNKLEYTNARNIYLQVANNGYKSAHVLKRIGDTYYLERELENAVEWYAELITKYSDYEDDYLFRYAQSLKVMKLYNKAYDVMREYYHRKGVDPGSMLKKRETDYINLIEKQSGRFSLLDFKYNSVNLDFLPQFMSNEKLIFSSDRYVLSADGNNTKYQPPYEVSGIDPEKKPDVINTEFDASSMVYTKDGNTVYFSRSNKINNKKSKLPMATMPKTLYRATVKNGKWKNSKKLPFNSNRYSVSHPALSPDGKKLYFVSDMPGRLGKSDLFAVDIKKDGTFGKPYNLGNTINTLGNETSPFIAKNGDLYFASDTHFGLGGLDLFVSKYYQGKYQEPINLGKPINSIHDDTSFIIDDKTKQGYFASNRNFMDNIKDNFDIYKCKQQKDLVFNCGQYVHGKIIDSRTNKAVQSCTVKLLDKDFNEIAHTISDENGYYQLDIQGSDEHLIRVSKFSYYLTEKILYTSRSSKKNIELSIKLNHGKGHIKSIVFAGDALNDILELSPIYFDIDAAKIRSDAEIEIQKVITVLKSNPLLKIKIRSYTDNKGKNSHNKRLSEKRAIATKNYIVEKGMIAPDRITIEALGQSNPIADCGKDCTENENQFNRRSEFIFIR